MNPIEIAQSAHLQTLRSLRVHKDRELDKQDQWRTRNPTSLFYDSESRRNLNALNNL